MARRETSAEIEQQAALWAARVDNAPLTGAEEAELGAWLEGDSRRVGAYAMARATLARVEIARALGSGYDPDRFLEEDDRAEPATRAGLSRRRMLWVSGSAAAAAGIGAIGLGLFGRGHRYATATGEMLRIALADGSIVNLNTASAIDVRFTQERRTVLLQGGEVLFDVAKDSKRPFIVVAGKTNVQAVGTSFTVRKDGDAPVDVVVNEGVVEVSQTDIDAAPVRLTENMQAKADPRAAVPIAASDVDPDVVARRLFWREGKIGFSDATLADAAAEFARYNDQRIVVPDAAIAQQKITGLFVATDPEGFAEAVASSLGLQARQVGNTITLTAS